MTKRNSLTFLVLILMLIVLPLVLLLTRQRQEIRKRAAENDAVVLFGSSSSTTLAPGASITGAVNITAGATSMSSVRTNLVYDPAKITITNLSCGTKLPTPANSVTTPGNLALTCGAEGEANAVSGQTFTAVTFTVTASSSLGSTTVTLGDLTKAYHGNTLITLNKNNGTVQVAAAGPGSVLNFFFGSSAVSPGGTNTGVVKIAAGTSPVKSAQIVLTYDASKITLSNLRCGTEFSNMLGSSHYGSGTADITCGTPSGNNGISGRTFDAALFDMQVSSTAAPGTITLSLASNTGLSDKDSAAITATLNPGTFQISGGGATPTPTNAPEAPVNSITAGALTLDASGRYHVALTLSANPAPALTMGGETSGNVLKIIGAPSSAAASDIRNTLADSGNCTSTLPTGGVVYCLTSFPANGTIDYIFNPGAGPKKLWVVFHNDASHTAGSYWNIATSSWSSPVSTGVIDIPGGTASPTPTATLDPNSPGVFSLEPASTTVGASPVLVEIKLNSGVKKVNTAQVVINVDSKLTVVDSSGNAATTITGGNTSLSNSQINRYASSKITYLAGKASGTTPAVTVNGTFAKFYVKSSETSGTASLSFVTTGEDLTVRSYILDENSVNVLGSSQPLTLNLGTTTPGVVISNLRHALSPTPMPSPAVQTPYVVVSFDTNVQTTASWVLTLPNGDKLCPPNAPASLGCYTNIESFRHTTPATTHSFVAGNLIPGAYTYTVYAAISGDANSVVSKNSADPAFTVVAGNTFTFKLKFFGIDANPTSPSVPAGLDYGHETAKVTIKSGDTIISTASAVLNAGAGGLYTSDPINISGVPAGTYKLYVKPNYYFQKRFTGVVFPISGVLDLNSTGYKNYKFEAGDTNNDGVINLMDVNNVIALWQKEQAYRNENAYNKTNLTAQEYKMIDFNRDGFINSGDTAAIFETMKIRYDDE